MQFRTVVLEYPKSEPHGMKARKLLAISQRNGVGVSCFLD